MNTAKMQKNAKKIDTFLKVIQRILIIAMSVGIVCLALLAIISAIDPAFLIGETQHQIEIGSIVFTLAEGYTPDNASLLTYFGIFLLLGAVCIAGICYAIGCFRRILQSVCQGNPFYPTVGRDIRKIGFVCVGVGIVDNVAKFLEAHNMLQNLGLLALMENGPITHISVVYDFNLTFLIVFFVLLLISYIFEYGVQLQQLSDETL
ncbi:MAG: DUF2975 domain-containing protein [Oscillospiraceae bacterium]|nr:DUF2975 domain-containing protein [Oscillospiraceae bacterium]